MARLLLLDSNRYDLVYSLGLYDYLSADIAAVLTHRLLDCLAQGGTMILANFTPYPASFGYMESAMGWSLTFRDES